MFMTQKGADKDRNGRRRIDYNQPKTHHARYVGGFGFPL